MKRAEYNEYRSIRSSLRKMKPTYGTQCTIRTDASPEYKAALDKLYTECNMHPASIRIDSRMFDEKERIVYIYGRNDVFTDYYGRKYTWEYLYTEEEKNRFKAALQ